MSSLVRSDHCPCACGSRLALQGGREAESIDPSSLSTDLVNRDSQLYAILPSLESFYQATAATGSEKE